MNKNLKAASLTALIIAGIIGAGWLIVKLAEQYPTFVIPVWIGVFGTWTAVSVFKIVKLHMTDYPD